MAIDTRDERFSLLNLALTSRVLPNPDGSFNAGDRAQLVYLYRGIALNPPSPTAPQGTHSQMILRRRNRRRIM